MLSLVFESSWRAQLRTFFLPGARERGMKHLWASGQIICGLGSRGALGLSWSLEPENEEPSGFSQVAASCEWKVPVTPEIASSHFSRILGSNLRCKWFDSKAKKSLRRQGKPRSNIQIGSGVPNRR